jgi:hypothetical protein
MGIYQPGHKTAPEQQIIVFFEVFRLAWRRIAAYPFILLVDKKHRPTRYCSKDIAGEMTRCNSPSFRNNLLLHQSLGR